MSPCCISKYFNRHNRAPNSNEGVVILGGGASRWSTFGSPESLVLADNGDLFICDSGYHLIQRYSPKTNSTETLVNNVDCSQLFLNQNGELLFSTSTLALYKWLPSEKRAQMIMKPAGKILPSIGRGSRMFLSQNGNVYITDPQNDRILKYTPGQNDAEIIAGGQTWQSTDLTYLESPVSVVADDKGILYIGNMGYKQIVRWDVAASVGFIVKTQPDVGYNFLIRFDRKGNLYAASYTSSACSKFSNNFLFPCYKCVHFLSSFV